MGISRDATARQLAGLSDGQADHLHYGAAAVALRVLGRNDDEAVRIIYRWHNSDNPPPFLTKVTGKIAAWESAIRRHAETPSPK